MRSELERSGSTSDSFRLWASTIFAGGLGNVPVIAARPIKSGGHEWCENSGEPSTRLGPERRNVRTKTKSLDMMKLNNPGLHRK
jgi:hypothetical protein